jgi:predicted NAD-dependent protein-ADP-ribosyltransferase YbiA (DUF1768 family)
MSYGCALTGCCRYEDNEAFYHAQKPKPFDEKVWQECRAMVMMRGIRLKFAACPHARALLISTWPHPLLSIKRDTFWGFHPVDGGSNTLAVLLMQLRDELMMLPA